MDDKLRCCARERYANDIQNAHEILHDFYNSQPNIFLPPNDNGTIHQSINHSKFIELPYHAFIIANRSQTTITSFVESVYLCDLNWIQMKLKTTKCVQYILNDIHLIDDALRLKYPHLNLLNEFFEINKSALNYDSSQFYPLLKYFIKKHIADDSAIVQNVVVQKWIEAFETIPISYLDIVDISIDGNENSCDEATTDNGFDFISNLGGNGYFVASLNTEREEICVWDVPRQVKLANVCKFFRFADVKFSFQVQKSSHFERNSTAYVIVSGRRLWRSRFESSRNQNHRFEQRRIQSTLTFCVWRAIKRPMTIKFVILFY